MGFEQRFVNVHDFQKAAHRRLPKIFSDYVDGGAFSETTLRRNRADFDLYALRQRVLTPLADPDLTTRLGNQSVALPFGAGPVGFMGLYRRSGEVHVARASEAAGVPSVLSTFSIDGLETVTREAGAAPDFQLYIDKDPEVTAGYLDQARRAGVKRIFLTVDTAVTSVRERDVRNGFRSTERLTPGLVWQFARRPAWSLDLLRRGFPEVELVRDRPEFGKGALAQASHLSARLEKALTWDLVQRLREDWSGQLIVKGISDPEDAAMARESGADGIVLSNHGGRQLDHGTSTISQVSLVREALGAEKLLYVDSGFRTGSDILKALALGADFVLLGRPFAWAVAAGGEAGVARLFDILRTEMTLTLQLMGVTSIEDLKRRGPEVLIECRR
ncbi:alpha-hydroxy acid oxidase [Tropicimonas isoalkanivorans]|uniref:FMN-dependent dehydrogenase, includes L-lactate dehydrogenase and type II isopentenyl diphosphate isomerase n=1 Tax=Tropicimonas isoalkanivorans TaxID=441112 RepID=A0A1I1HKL6_9RHOB|nr:alpha-hydroxy acid oxidase [Tropicimonas isoalkanivorans]SFC22508.1 FMN-dependent dehydrogenase, includes L-lactate dehydrogenase and type II isopentenyl diphosphate isomerase [Tropicimonas isoalkanivorans]